MRQQAINHQASTIVWRQFTRRKDAAFLSLGKQISIGVLSVASLASVVPSSATAQTVRIATQGSPADEGGITTIGATDMALLEEGDLLFNVVSPQADGLSVAITDVTEGYDLRSISHVAIVCKRGESTFALEACGKHGVWLNPLDSFVVHADKSADGRPMILVGRLKDRTNVTASVSKALTYVGRPYDYVYMPTDEAIYCSELVQLSFTYADGREVFSQEPMSFHDSTGKVTDFWTSYYAERGLTVPEGLPGTNPGGISRSKEIDIIYSMY